MTSHAQYALIPAEWHTPLKQRMVLLKMQGLRPKPFTAICSNRLDVTVTKMLTLGDEVCLTMQIDGVTPPLQASIPLRLAAELGVCVGQRTSVTLRAGDIHLLPTEIAPSRDA